MAKHYSTWPKWPTDDEHRDQANEAQRERVRLAMQKLRERRKREGLQPEPGPRLSKLERECFERWFEQLKRREPKGYGYIPYTGASVMRLLENLQRFAFRHYHGDARFDIGINRLAKLLRLHGVTVRKERDDENYPEYAVLCAIGYWPNVPDKAPK